MDHGTIAGKDASTQTSNDRAEDPQEVQSRTCHRRESLQGATRHCATRRKEATSGDMGRDLLGLGYQSNPGGSATAKLEQPIGTRKATLGPSLRDLWGNPQDRLHRSASHSSTQRSQQIRRSREAALGKSHGSQKKENAGPMPNLPYGPPCGTSIEAKTITFSNGVTPMMLESHVQ